MKTSFKYLIAFLLGLLVMPMAIKAALIERQYFAIGGEILIPFIFVALVALGTEFKELAKEMFGQADVIKIKRHKKSTPRSAQNKIISLN